MHAIGLVALGIEPVLVLARLDVWWEWHADVVG
jgi:hypothetical protein